MEDEYADSETQAATQAAYDAANTWNQIATMWYNYSSQKLQREDMYHFFNVNYIRNLPKTIMALNREAGLNPYSDFTTAPTNQPSIPNYGIDASGLGDALSKSAEHAYNKLMARIQLKSLQNDEKRVDLESKKLDLLKRSSSASSAYQELLNSLFESTFQDKINISRNEVDSLLQDVISKRLENSYKPEVLAESLNQLTKQVEKLEAEIAATKYDTDVYKPKTLGIAIKDASQRTEQGEINLQLLKNQLLQSNFDVSALEQLDNLLDNSNMSDKNKSSIKGIIKTIITILKSN